jgi:polyhydroxyalkanoate synthesis regulator phasin
MPRSVVETGVAWNKIKSLFIVQENEGGPGVPAASPEDHAVIEAELQKYQVPASEPAAQLPPDTDPSKLSGTIDFQAMYDTAGVPNTDEVEALEKFLVELENDLPQASKLAAAKAFLKAIGKSSVDVLNDAARKIKVVRAIDDGKSTDTRSAIQSEQAAIDALQKQIDDHRSSMEAMKRDLESVKHQCTVEEGRLQGARMFFGAMDKLADSPPPAPPAPAPAGKR